nr:Dihydrofolate reductase [uncultured bacterium]
MITHVKNSQPVEAPLSAVVAMAKNRVIGKNNQLPWHLPADLKHFKALTSGGVVIMGRKTFTSIGKKLPNRVNIIVTRDKNFFADDCLIAHSVQDAIALAREQDNEHLFVIGGNEIYEQAMPYLEKIYLTTVEQAFSGDTYFPLLDPLVWQETSREEHHADEKNPYDYAFTILERV